MKLLLQGFKNLLGVGAHLLLLGLLVEGGAVLLRQWVSWPIPLGLELQIALTVLLVSAGLAGLAWFNYALNLIQANLLDGERKLVTHGPFNYVRHPLYATLLLTLLPLTIVWFADWVFVGAWVLMLVISHYVVGFEERGLVKEFGQEYERYRRYVPALIPHKGAGGKRYQAQDQT